VYMNRLTARPNTPKEFVILHVSFLDEQMTEFLRKKNRVVEFEGIIRTYRRVIDYDIFK